MKAEWKNELKNVFDWKNYLGNIWKYGVLFWNCCVCTADGTDYRRDDRTWFDRKPFCGNSGGGLCGSV